jgi:hypothetical protein
MATETKDKPKNGTPPKAVAKPAAPAVTPSPYKAGQIWEPESRELKAAFDHYIGQGATPEVALTETAKHGQRRPEVIARNKFCPWAANILPVREKGAPRAPRVSKAPEVSPEVLLIRSQTAQARMSHEGLEAFALAISEARKVHEGLKDQAAKQWFGWQIQNLVVMQTWLPANQLVQSQSAP